MRRFRELGLEEKPAPDWGDRHDEHWESRRGERQELHRVAVSVINSYSYVEYLSELLVLRLTPGDTEVSHKIWRALQAKGPKRGVVEIMTRAYMNPDLADYYAELVKQSKKAVELRNFLAHHLWYCLWGKPEYLILVEPGPLSDVVAGIQSTGEEGGNAPWDEARVYVKGELQEADQANRNLATCWSLLLGLLREQGNPAAVEHQRTLLAKGLGMSPPEPPSQSP